MTNNLEIPEFLSEADRNSQKYERLVSTMRKATEELRSVAKGSPFEVEDFLRKLLPHYVTAFEAKDGFVLRRSSLPDRTDHFELIISSESGWPTSVQSEWLSAVVRSEHAQILWNLRRHAPDELLQLGIENAIVASLHTLDHVYILSIYNKSDSDRYPFLAADRIVLDSLLTSISATLRTSERLHREHKAIEEITQEITNGNMGDLTERIARHTVSLSNSQYAMVYSIDKEHELLKLECDWDISRGRRSPLRSEVLLCDPSLNAWVASQRQSRYISNIDQADHPVIRDKFAPNVRAAYCVPLISRTHLVGTLSIASTNPVGISLEDRHTVDRLSPLVAVALHNALLYKENQARWQIDEEIINLQAAIANVLVEDQQTQQVHDVLRHRFSEDHNFFIATFEERTESIRLRIVYENGERIGDIEKHPNYKERKKGTRRGLIDYMLRNQKSTLHIPDFSAWEDKAEIEDAYASELQCCLVVELMLPRSNHRVGWLGFRGTNSSGMFTPEQRLLIEKLAPHIAIVLRNSQEYAQRIKELGVVSAFQTQISNLNDTEASEITQIVTEVRKALIELGIPTDDLYLALYDRNVDRVHVPTAYIEGRELSAEERQAIPTYQDRHLDQRKGFTEWIITHGSPILARNPDEIQAWREKGIDVVPEQFRCWLGVPMIAAGYTTGVMAVRSSTKPILFTEAHSSLLQTIANQAAVTLENARSYQRSQELLDQHTALYQASRAISEAGLERDAILHTIIQQATDKTGSHLGVLYLKDEKADALDLIVAHPASLYTTLRASRHRRINIQDTYIVARAMRENQAQLVSHVVNDPDYVDISNGITRSELAVVLREGGRLEGKTLGVINLEHNQSMGLNENDRLFLIALSNLAVAAIQNSEQVKMLARNQKIAAMGAWGADVVHDINREVSRIRETILELTSQIDLSSDIQYRLDEIDRIAGRMQLPQLPSDNPTHDSGEISNHPEIDRVLRAEIDDFMDGGRLRQTRTWIEFIPGCPGTSVRIHEAWIRRLVRHFLTNAEKYLPNSIDARVIVATSIENGLAVVSVEDNGKGVRNEIRDQLFEMAIFHENARPGQGLVLVRNICELHNGNAWLDWSQIGKGSRFKFSVPIYSPPEQGELDAIDKSREMLW